MSLKVIGTGLSRTGTMSTRMALEQLGFGPCHHMMELFADPAQVALWTSVARGERTDWEAVFDGYATQVDFPGGRVWKQTLARPSRTQKSSIPSARRRNGGPAFPRPC